MSYVRYEAIIVTTYDSKLIEKAYNCHIPMLL
jgi:hypothetical protein